MPRDGRKIIDLTGQRIEHFVIIGKTEKTYKGKQPIWKCRCDCGQEFEKPSKYLKYGRTIDCGCGHNERVRKNHTTHGMSGNGKKPPRIYRIWATMKARCRYSTTNNYEHYGGRGIRVCDEWLGKEGFQKFYDWALKNGYNDNLTIDRIDVNGNYEPNNCRWVTFKVQENNRRNNTLVKYEGQIYTLSELSELLGIPEWKVSRMYKDSIIQRKSAGKRGLNK